MDHEEQDQSSDEIWNKLPPFATRGFEDWRAPLGTEWSLEGYKGLSSCRECLSERAKTECTRERVAERASRCQQSRTSLADNRMAPVDDIVVINWPNLEEDEGERLLSPQRADETQCGACWRCDPKTAKVGPKPSSRLLPSPPSPTDKYKRPLLQLRENHTQRVTRDSAKTQRSRRTLVQRQNETTLETP